MATLADSLTSSSSRPLALRKRPDLTARQQRYQGRGFWVVKEPVGLKYFRFHEEEYAVLLMLDGQVSLDEIRTRFQERFAPQKISLSELQQFIGMLHRNGLVYAPARSQGEQLKRRRDDRKHKERMAMLTNVLAVRFKGVDPERFLNGLYPYIKWFFSPVAVLLCCALGLTALSLVATQFDVFQSRLPAFQEFFGPQNWLYLGLTMAVVKIMHELGHGLSCKHFGGECHEIGIMLLVLTPCLYCNVSDSWMLPSKWRRAAIGAAGMYVELVLASIATFVWWFSDPGMLNHLALRVVFICSVSTVLFNANPLLRYDGYYILSDLSEIPNLRQKATTILNRIMSRWCLGLELPEAPFLPKRNHLFFALFTVASNVYRWVVLLSILWFLNKVFEPYGLKIIGQAIAAVSIGGLVIKPMVQLYKFVTVPGRIQQMKRRNAITTTTIVLAIITGILLIPIRRYVSCTLDLQPANAESVYVEVPGQLTQVMVRPDQHVEANAALAQFSSIELEQQVAELQGQYAEYQVRLKSLKSTAFGDKQKGPQASARIPQVEEALESIKNQLNNTRAEQQRLHLVAPISGTVFSPPPRANRPQTDGGLQSLSGTLLDPKNIGAAITETVLFCEIGDPNRREAELIVDQSDIELVAEGQQVEIKLDAYPHRIFTGHISSISRNPVQAAPRSLSNQAGGELATQTDASGVTRPMNTSYTARVLIDGEIKLRVGLRGRAKIDTGRVPLGSRIWRYLSHTFHFWL